MSFGETTQLLLCSQPEVKLSWWHFVFFLCHPLRDKNDDDDDDDDDDDYDNNGLDGDEEDDGDDDNGKDDGVELEH